MNSNYTIFNHPSVDIVKNLIEELEKKEKEKPEETPETDGEVLINPDTRDLSLIAQQAFSDPTSTMQDQADK